MLRKEKASKQLDAVNVRILELSKERPVHPDELAQLFGVSRPAVDQRISKLIVAGLVKKIRGQDGRVYITCTKAGANALREIRSGRPFAPPVRRGRFTVSILIMALFALVAVMSFWANFAKGSLGLAIFSATFWLLAGLAAVWVLSRLITRLK